MKMDTAEATAIRSPSDRDLRVPCYCEENAWRLVYRHLHGPGAARNFAEWGDDAYHVVFISNGRRACPFFQQRILPEKAGDYVCWDYHVVVARSRTVANGTRTETQVLDIDTWLPYPCSLEDYLDGSFHNSENWDRGYLPFFRVVPAESYLKYYYSDRMHMFKDGRWLSPPPEYEPIMNGLSFVVGKLGEHNGNMSNLDMYLNMGNEIDVGVDVRGFGNERGGEVFSLGQFRARFTCSG